MAEGGNAFKRIDAGGLWFVRPEKNMKVEGSHRRGIGVAAPRSNSAQLRSATPPVRRSFVLQLLRSSVYLPSLSQTEQNFLVRQKNQNL